MYYTTIVCCTVCYINSLLWQLGQITKTDQTEHIIVIMMIVLSVVCSVVYCTFFAASGYFMHSEKVHTVHTSSISMLCMHYRVGYCIFMQCVWVYTAILTNVVGHPGILCIWKFCIMCVHSIQGFNNTLMSWLGFDTQHDTLNKNVVFFILFKMNNNKKYSKQFF